MLWVIPPLLLLGGAAVVAKKKRASKAAELDKADAPDDLPDPSDVDRVDVRQLALSVGAPLPWANFFLVTAYGESRLNPNVGLGSQTGAPPWVKMNISANDAKASERAYERNKDWIAGCWPRVSYTFGSGGLFQMFPANAISVFQDSVYRCNHSWSIFDPIPSMIYAAWAARRLQQWSEWRGTVVSMRAGWMSPSVMGKAPSPAKRAKWERHCEAVGLPSSFLDEKLPRWKPAPALELWERFDLGSSWLPPNTQV